MKYSQCVHTFGREKSTEKVLEEIAEIGFQGVEFFAGEVEKYYDEPEKFQRILTSRGLNLSSLYCGGITSEIDGIILNRIINAAKFLSKLQVPIITIGPGGRSEEEYSIEEYRIIAETLNDLGEKCKEMGVYACFHPHYGTNVQTREEIDMILNLSDPNLVYFCPDTGHLVKGGCDPVKVIQTYVERVKYVHLKDFKEGRFVELGTGSVDHGRIFDALKAVGYNGWFTVEVPSASERNLTPKESSRISFEYLNRQFGLGCEKG